MTMHILIGGVSGVGKSHVSRILAQKLSCNYIGTDTIREIQRSVGHDEKSLFQSSYLAGHDAGYESESEDTKKYNIHAGFLEQKKIVEKGIEASLTRGFHEEQQIIVEGIHAAPLLFSESCCIEIFLYIASESVHISRLMGRTGHHRNYRRYIDNIREIRWIQDMLLEKAGNKNIMIIENSDKPEKCTEKIFRYLTKE